MAPKIETAIRDSATRPNGLSSREAEARLRADGFNELPRSKSRHPLRIVFETLREPMLALLLGSGLVYLLLGDLTEALLLLVFATMSVVITVVQETRTTRVLEALRDLASPRALVIRDGERKRIAGRDVVRGDLVVLSEGDRVPADAVLVEGNEVSADESLLTGESVPVRKAVAESPLPRIPEPGGDDLPFVFSGSLIVRGSGLAEVVGTGARSSLGRIGQSLTGLSDEPPRLQAEVRRLVRTFATAGAAVSIFAVLLYGIFRGSWLDGVLAGIALGMSMLPEEFPVVLTVFMAMGAWRISRARVLTRRPAAIESLGSATVLCTDKTGTLTENRMTIVELRSPDGEIYRPAQAGLRQVPGHFSRIVQCGILASAINPFDPMELAFHELGSRVGEGERDHAKNRRMLVHSYGLRPELLAVTQVWQMDSDKKHFVIAVKGAPEAVMRLCHLPSDVSERIRRDVNAMASGGLRILGIAEAMYDGPPWPETPTAFQFKFVGLAGLADPLRVGVRDAVAQCRSAGIRVVMITGDYPVTARAIAEDAGFDVEGICTGNELETLSDAILRDRVRRTTIFARIMPQQKLRIVNAFKTNGEIVAMTGDGVNDAPSLKAAHIGIAMGGRGTDVAREAASIVLLDDDFASVVKSIRLGRRIYDNLQKAAVFIFAVHIPIAGLAILPLAFGLPILFGPVHIAFLEMVIDPVCSLVFEAEAEEEDVMRRPPRAPDSLLFSYTSVIWGAIQGILAFSVVASMFVIELQNGMAADEARALAFFSLVLTIVSLIFANRSFSASLVTAFRRPNPALAWVLSSIAAILALSLLWPVLSNMLRFGALHADDLGLTVASAAAVLVTLESLKSFLISRQGQRPLLR